MECVVPDSPSTTLLKTLQRYHEGTIEGDHPINFGDFANELFIKTIRPEFAKYLRKVFRKYSQLTSHTFLLILCKLCSI